MQNERAARGRHGVGTVSGGTRLCCGVTAPALRGGASFVLAAALLGAGFSCDVPGEAAPRASAPLPEGALLAPDGEHYGVYRQGKFELRDRSGVLLSSQPAAPLGFRHKLAGNGRVLAPVVQRIGAEEGRMIGLQIRDARGALQAEIAVPDGVRFSRPSADAITLASAGRVARHALDGQELWSLPLVAQEIAVAAERDAVAVVPADDARRVLLFDGGRRVAAADLREPIWNAAFSASGAHLALTTRHSLHAFSAARLQLNLTLPLAYAVSLAVAEDGRMLVGGQDAEKRGRVLCYAPDGALLAEQTLPAEDHGFRPAVRWLDAERYVARGSAGEHGGRCPIVAPRRHFAAALMGEPSR